MFIRLFNQFQIKFKRTNKVYIIPSRFGMMFVFITFLSFIFSLSFGHSLSYLFSISLIIFFLLCAVSANNYLADFILSYPTIDIFAKEFSKLNIKFEKNSELNWSTFKIYFRYNGKMKQITNGQFSFETNTWGTLKHCEILVESYFPFFLFKTWKYIDYTSNIFIYPVANVQMDSIVDKDFEPNIRPFVDGDLYSKINWKKSRLDKLITNIMENNSEEGDVKPAFTFDESILINELSTNDIKELLLKFDYMNQISSHVIRSDGSKFSKVEVLGIVRNLLQRTSYGEH